MSKLLAYGQKRARVRRFIQAYLDEAGKNQPDVAVLAGVTPQAVSSTICGHIHSPKVLGVLRELGVPEKYLFDPHKTTGASL